MYVDEIYENMGIAEFYERQDAALLEKLSTTPPTENTNYLRVIEKIKKQFKESAPIVCFNFGMMKGRECEKDLLTWNATATFHNMKTYASHHNGVLPDTQKELHEWIEATCKELVDKTEKEL